MLRKLGLFLLITSYLIFGGVFIYATIATMNQWHEGHAYMMVACYLAGLVLNLISFLLTWLPRAINGQDAPGADRKRQPHVFLYVAPYIAAVIFLIGMS